jgi:hypothetical protein
VSGLKAFAIQQVATDHLIEAAASFLLNIRSMAFQNFNIPHYGRELQLAVQSVGFEGEVRCSQKMNFSCFL